MAGDGRNQVVTQQLIDIGWGNAIADRTVQSFASAAARDSQWASPRAGAACYTADTDEYWVLQGGAWKRQPLGFAGIARGPGAVTDCTAAWRTVVQLNFAAKLGRRYQAVAYANGLQITKGGGITGCILNDDQGGAQYLSYSNNQVVNTTQLGTTSYLYTPTSTKTSWVRIQAMSAVAGGGIRYQINSAMVFVNDVGG